MPIQSTEIIRPSSVTAITGWDTGDLNQFIGKINDGQDGTIITQADDLCEVNSIVFGDLGSLPIAATINSISLVFKCRKFRGNMKIISTISDDLGDYSDVSTLVESLVLVDVELPELTVNTDGTALTIDNVNGLELSFSVAGETGQGAQFRLVLADIFINVSIQTPIGTKIITIESGTITLDSGKITVE